MQAAIVTFAPLWVLTSAASALAADTSELDNPPVPILAKKAAAAPVIRVGMVDSGVNYLLPFIQRSLARSSSGKLIGYDYWDMDDRPFDAHPGKNGVVQRHGTQTASLLIKEAPFVRLVPYRYPRPDMQRMEPLLQHARQHKVRILGLALGGNRKEDWLYFEQAAKKYPEILFVASAGNNGRDIDEEPVYPASLTLSNLLVVTSADDFVRLANGVNWGRVSVDYMVPAEMQSAMRFDGSEALVSGSSYAVPRVVALAARLLRHEPSLDAQALISRIRSKFANGANPRRVGQGYLHDPQFDAQALFSVGRVVQWQPSADTPMAASVPDSETLSVALDAYVLDERWSEQSVKKVLHEAQEIMGQCNVVFKQMAVNYVNVKEYLTDLETGRSKTLMETIGRGGRVRNAAVFFARDTQMNQRFDAEAFGQGNTRSRPWLTNSVWLTLALKDRGIALAHELFHVLANNGQHSAAKGNLMLARTTGDNRLLTEAQCIEVRRQIAEQF